MNRLGEIYRRFDSYELGAAREALRRVEAEGGADPGALRYLRVLEAFYGGDYRQALERLEGYRFQGMGMEGDSLRTLLEDTDAAVARLATTRSDRFVVRFDADRDWVLAEEALAVLEACRRLLDPLFAVSPEEAVRVEIFPDAASFQKASSLSRKDIETSGAIGICKFNKIMVLTPRALAYGYRWKDTLAHEYLHYLLTKRTANQAPIWVQEGVARYFEERWRKDDAHPLDPAGESLLAEALAAGKLIPFEAMDPSLVKLESAEQVTLAFAQCATAVDFLVARVGMEGLGRFLEGIRQLGTRGTREALRQVTGLDFEGFQEGWRRHIGAMGLVRREHYRLDSYALADQGWSEAALEGEIRSLTAKNYLRLGDTMRRNGRLRPALIEYRRAARESPESPYVLNKVAITAILMEDWETARDFLEKAAGVSRDYPLTHLTRGTYHLRRGEAREALASFEEYNALNPYNPAVYLLMAEAGSAAGRTEESSRYREAARRLGSRSGGRSNHTP
jgi:tetratricopeptide (TPR) repeat protein